MSKRRMVVDELSFGPNVPGARSFCRRLFVEADALAFVQLIEAAFHRAAVKEPLLPAFVADESKASVANESFDRTARHPSLPWVRARSRNINSCSTSWKPGCGPRFFSGFEARPCGKNPAHAVSTPQCQP